MTPSETSLLTLEDRLQRICRWEKDPNTLRSAFADLLRLHYSDANHLISQDIKRLQDYVWHPDPAKSKIFIDVHGKFDPKIVETRPAIFVGISDMDFERSALRNEAQQDFLTGNDYYATINKCQILLHHIGATADEVLALARMTATYFIAFSQKIRKEFNLGLFNVSKLSRPAILYEAKERWISTVFLDIIYFETWKVAVESHKLKTIRLRPTIS